MAAMVCAGALAVSAAVWTAKAQWPGAGITAIASGAQPASPEIVFTVDRGLPGEGWVALAPHAGPYDQHDFDIRLVPGIAARIRASLTTAEGARIDVEQIIDVENDTAYVAFASIGPDDPTAMCMGCSAAVSKPLRAEDPAGDRLWLYTSFNGINHTIQF